MYILEALIITIIYLVDLLLLVPKYTRCKYDHTPRVNKLIWKGVCIGLPLLVLLYGTVKTAVIKGVDYSMILFLIGMALCAIGDVVLEIRFVKGGVLFFFGHVTYIIALFYVSKKLSIISLLIYLALVGVGSYLTMEKLSKKYRSVLLTYNFAISGSFALSIPLILTFEPAFIMVGVGACLLVASDWLLARNKTYGSTYTWSLISLLCYFGGQILISSYPFLK